MSPTASTPSSNEANGSTPYRVVRKRNRVPLSCAPCRNRKLKCNRSQPCENCVKRGDAGSCSYATPGSRRKTTGVSPGSQSPDNMQGRIDRLEALVLSLMTNGAQSPGPAAAARALSMSASSSSQEYLYQHDTNDEMVKDEDEDGESETEEVAKSLGVLRVDNTKATSMYVGDAHWGAILNDISEVRTYFLEHKKQYEEHSKRVDAVKKSNGFAQGPAFLFGGRNLLQLPELLEQLPSKETVDRCVSHYFNDYDPAIHILHPPSWRRQYEKHWKDPSKTHPAWLGQLFAILCLTMHSYHRSGEEPYEFSGRTLTLAAEYRFLTAQCLLLADFTKPVNSMIETMVLHLHGEYARSREAEVGVWVLVGIIVRLAMRMGYHRDPKYYSNLNPFQGEMRRRVWTFVRQADLLFSFQIGLPSMIRLNDCDTSLPRNLYDEEFDEDSEVLPPSRPASSPTPVSYMIAKAQVTFAFGRIIESLHSTQPKSYDDIERLDHELREAYANIPPHLRLKPIEESTMDPVSVVMQRYSLSVLYNKGQCVLHRRYLTKARESSRFAHSRKTCIDSSLQLLRHQATLHFESRPSRRLHCMKWYINSLTAHDFLLAATLVCLDLWYATEAEAADRVPLDSQPWDKDRRAEMVQAIATSRDIWNELRDQSMEAYKASELLTVMLQKLESLRSQGSMSQAQRAAAFGLSNMSNSMKGANRADGASMICTVPMPDEEKPEHSAAITLGLLSSGGLTPNSQPFGGGNFSNSMQDNGSLLAPLPSMSPPPGFSADQYGSMYPFAPSPFSGNNGPVNSIDLPPTNLDWDAWDSYIQNTSLDSANDAWPMPMDIPVITPSADPENGPPDLTKRFPTASGMGGFPGF